MHNGTYVGGALPELQILSASEQVLTGSLENLSQDSKD